MEEKKTFTSIRQWAEDDRPREKMLLKGKSALSDAELIAILINSGNKNESAVDLAKRILHDAGDNLLQLSKLSIGDLMKYRGMGEAKAISIMAALELGKRRRESEALEKIKLTSSRDAFELIQSDLTDLTHEEFWLLLLNNAQQLIRKVCISQGGFTGTVADPKKIFKLALENSACHVILAHNHPSGNLKPSDNDIKLTKKLKEAGAFLEMPVLDHIIVGEEKYFSFADEGLM
jgi:DNA repair protein RadC